MENITDCFNTYGLIGAFVGAICFGLCSMFVEDRYLRNYAAALFAAFGGGVGCLAGYYGSALVVFGLFGFGSVICIPFW